MGLVFLLDLDAICQHLLIHRIRCLLLARKELFHLISEKAADMIAVVDLEGSRLVHSLPYRKVLGSLLEGWQTSSAFEQTQPRERGIESAAQDAQRAGMGRSWVVVFATRLWNSLLHGPFTEDDLVRKVRECSIAGKRHPLL